MIRCWTYVSLWIRLNHKALHSEKLRAWLDVVELKLNPFDLIKATFMISAIVKLCHCENLFLVLVNTFC